MPDLFKEVIPSILHTKKQVFETAEEADSFYLKNSYIINKTLSMYADTVFYANLINFFWQLDGKLKHDFFMSVVRGYRRKFNYAKSEKLSNSLKAVKEYYGVSDSKAKEYLSLLNDEQIHEITKRLEKGGVK